MILRTFTLTLGASSPTLAAASELRDFFGTKLAEYTALNRDHADTFIHRYPAVQCKMIGTVPTVVGINEGADVLKQIADGFKEIRLGENIYPVDGTELSMKEEAFGLTDSLHPYEFVSPYLALNQENYRKFYTLKGKPERDAFIRKILAGNLQTLAKALNCDLPGPIRCEVNLHFQKDRIDNVNVMVFTGKFNANFHIPDYLGIGMSVSRGFGAVKHL